MNEIKIEIDNTITRLAGNTYGQRIYKEQVQDHIDYEDVNMIIFPPSIENIAISFVQGFSKGILEKISKEEFNSKIKLDASEKVKVNFLKYIIY